MGHQPPPPTPDAVADINGDNDPPPPKPIRRLDTSLVNRIAAGEIIHRPSSALKELLENSLDAGSKSIRVTVKDGGLKLLQIQDDGCGIRKADLPLLAERFTTSKLSTFSDLAKIATYGFRGEALASISFVSHLSVVSKTREDSCAWKASYKDGCMMGKDAKPCAGNDGTLITVEDLFYNTPTRLSSLRSNTDEYARILDVVSRYAVHNPHVAFSCKKAGNASPDISTPGSNSSTGAQGRAGIPALIRMLHGPSVAHELVHVVMSSSRSIARSEERKAKTKPLFHDEEGDEILDSEPEPEDEEMDIDGSGGEVKWTGEAYATSANYHAKKMGFLLFINHRAVDSSRIKRAVEAVYNAILPKGTSPFVYLSLNIDPASVDVNVHPTKREVHFLDEDKIIASVADHIQMGLASQNGSRTFAYQTLLAGPASAPRSAPSQTKSKAQKELEQVSKFRDDHSENGDDDGDEDGEAEGLHAKPKASAHVSVNANAADGQNTGAGPSTPAMFKFSTSGSSTPLKSTSASTSTPKPKAVYAHHKVRGATQHDRTLDGMFLPLPRSGASSPSGPGGTPNKGGTGGRASGSKLARGEVDADAIEVDSDSDGEEVSAVASGARAKQSETQAQTQTQRKAMAPTAKIVDSECFLQSILDLRAAIGASRHSGLSEILADVTFIGIVDLPHSITLVQHSTKLYVINHAVLAEELFYQLGVRQFGDFGRLHLDPPPSIKTLLELAVDCEESGLAEAGLEKPRVVNTINSLLIDQREMLEEYFSINITEDGLIESLPLLLSNYTPDLERLPLFLMRLGPEVDWTEERACFDSVLRELAYLYMPSPLSVEAPPNPTTPETPHPASDKQQESDDAAVQRWQVQHVLIPAIRSYLVPTKRMVDAKAVVQVASLPDLYKVFERC